ncbi:FAD-binding oxidoreductase [Microbacterium sp. 18062]|uniref:FAD-binding oxidoreductase n=1 Tax=Microbacterium sp. 18062 TaxID=2681410 RepID=UPI0013580091|nr:FAD-linked oxidase C-terminal domain-containing protein [Microbacterium sp. 18062]
MTVSIVDLLRDRIPPQQVIEDPAVLTAHATDASRAPAARAAVLARPASTAEVAAVVQVAASAGIPIVPQGGRSGLVGGSAAIDGAILLDLTGLDRILSIDSVDRVAVVQPGVIVADLQRAVAEHGLFYAPDPASADRATIGGTIGTNAGGMRCIKYGVTRDAVRSLEVVLADGTVERTRPATVKGVAGLDLTSLIVGSEGTLAVVTEATLALHPAPGPSRGVCATFPDAASAFEAANTIATGERLPSALEFLDEVALRGVRIIRPDLGIPEDARAWLLVVTDAHVGGSADLDHFEAAVREHGALTIARAEHPAALDELFAARRSLNAALIAVRSGTTHGDLAVPRSQLPAFAVGAERIRERLGVEISLAGHVGDGNLHPTVVFDGDDQLAVEAAHRAERELLELAQQLGGTIAGEHGIGTVKLDGLVGESSPRIRDLQRRIKAVFDPHGILNPGRKI